MGPRALVLLIVVLGAGCVGGGGAGTASSEEPPEATWTDGNGINESVLARQHFEALRAAGSFSRNHTATVSVDGATRPQELRQRPEWYSPPQYSHEKVNFETRRFLHRSVTVGHGRGATYVSPREDALRRKPCPSRTCSWQYTYLRRSDLDTATGEIGRYRRDRVVEMMVSVMDDWKYTYSETTERDGETVHRYTARWTFDRPMHPFTEKPTGRGTLLVTDEGVIRRWETQFVGPAAVTVDGETRRVNATQRNVEAFYAVGSTTVERPDWVDRARANDRPPETKTASA